MSAGVDWLGVTLDLSGVTPANVVPMTDSGEKIHEADLREHIGTICDVDGVNGVLCNGHAGEVYALTREEQLRVVEIVDSVTDRNAPVISGVVGGSTDRVSTGIRQIKEAGADAALVIPPHTPIADHPDAAVTFFQDITSAVDLPLIIFQHPEWAGGTYDSALLGKLVEIDGVIGVKDAVWDVDRYQDDVRAIRDSTAEVQVMVANDEHLLPSLALRSDGVFLELAAVIPDSIVELYEAVEASDLPRARSVYEDIEPFVDAIYQTPITDSHTRLKTALSIQGQIESATPRKPNLPISSEERMEIKQAMNASSIAEFTPTH